MERRPHFFLAKTKWPFQGGLREERVSGPGLSWKCAEGKCADFTSSSQKGTRFPERTSPALAPTHTMDAEGSLWSKADQINKL